MGKKYHGNPVSLETPVPSPPPRRERALMSDAMRASIALSRPCRAGFALASQFIGLIRDSRLVAIPPGCLALTAGVDTQDDRLELQIIGHGKNNRTWTIDYHILPGNPADEALWDQLTDYLSQPILNSQGKSMTIEATAIDSGGHYTHNVYQYVRRRPVRRVIAIKGANTPGGAILRKPSAQDVTYRGVTYKHGVQLYTVGSSTAKHLLYARLSGDADKSPDERLIRFSDQLDLSYYDQLVAETFNPRTNKWEVRRGRRNEALDTWIYALAASHHPELFIHKWKTSQWDHRSAMLEPVAANDTPTEPEKKTPADNPPTLIRHDKPTRRPGGFARNW
jgi:phage terminase large subunit GpA-like protein